MWPANLAEGRQPDMAQLMATGYLMRTTAVYGNGKFGLADFPKASAHPALAGPFRAEMLTVYLIRQLSFLLVNHVAKVKGGDAAVSLSPDPLPGAWHRQFHRAWHGAVPDQAPDLDPSLGACP